MFTLARSFDSNLQNTKQVHLICSRFNASGVIDFQTLSENLTGLGQIKNIVYLYLNDNNPNLEFKLRKPGPISELYENINLYVVEIYNLIHCIYR